MLHTFDPKKVLLDSIGDLDGVELLHNQVLCVVYLAPEKTAGGIIRPQSNMDEDKHQGKVGLIVKCGPEAFKADDKWSWPDGMGVGDWVFYRVSDGWPTSVNKTLCRVLADVDIKGRIEHPDQVW